MNLFKTVLRKTKEKSPAILIGAGIVGFVTTGVMAYKSAPKVNLIIEDKEKDAKENNTEFTKTDKALVIAKTMWPTLAIGLLSAVCIIASGKIASKRAAAFSTALALSEKAFQNYQSETLAKIGEEAEKEIRSAVAQKTITDTPKTETNIITKNSDKELCFDCVSGRYFYSTMNEIDAAVNKVNELLLDSDYVSLNDFYDELDIPHIEIGDDLGWDYHFNGALRMDKYAKITEEGVPCIVLDYEVFPNYYRNDR